MNPHSKDETDNKDKKVIRKFFMIPKSGSIAVKQAHHVSGSAT